MPDTPRYRDRPTTFTPEERAAYKAQAKRVDAQEKQAILAQARRFKVRMQAK